MADEEIEEIVLRDTGNGPTVSYEEEALRALYGEPDENGFYGRPVEPVEPELPVKVKGGKR